MIIFLSLLRFKKKTISKVIWVNHFHGGGGGWFVNDFLVKILFEMYCACSTYLNYFEFHLNEIGHIFG